MSSSDINSSANKDLTPVFIPPRLGTGDTSSFHPTNLYPSPHTWRKYGPLAGRVLSQAVPHRPGQEPTLPHSRVLFLGGVGSGKTTLLKHLQKQSTSAEGRWAFYLPLAETASLPLPEDLPAFLARDEVDENAVGKALEEGHCWVLVDDLDPADALSTTWLDRIVDCYPRNHYLATARAGLQEVLPGFIVLQIQPWSTWMLEQWITAQTRAGKVADKGALIGLVRAYLDQAVRLPLTPLFLSFLTQANREGLQFPRDFLKIYESYVRLLLARSRTSKGISGFLEPELQLELLTSLAVQGEESLPLSEAIRRLETRMRRIGLKTSAAAEVLQEVGIRCDLLRQVGKDRIEFACPGICQFLQARERLKSPVHPLPAFVPTLFYTAMAGDAGPVVVGLLRDRDDLFRGRLTSAARHMGVARYTPLEYRTQVQASLLRLFWQGPYEVLQQEALNAFCWITDRSLVLHFEKALKNRMAFIRARAAEALARLRAPESAVSLRHALQDESWKVRLHVVEALGRIGRQEHWKDLVVRLRDRHWQVRLAAAEALAWLGVDETPPLLQEALLEGYPSPQYTTAAVLVRLGLERESGFPLKAAGDQDLAVRLHLAEALLRFGENFLLPLLEYDEPRVRLAVAAVLAKTGSTEALEQLRQGCEEPDPALRYTAALGAAYLPFVGSIDYQADEREVMRPLVPCLTALLEDPVWKVRGVAAVALGSLGQPEWAPPIAALLDDEDHFVNTNAAVALGLSGWREAAPFLMEVLKDADRPETVRSYASRALGSLGICEARELLAKMLHQGGILLRLNASHGLGDVGDAASLELLLSRAVEDEEPAVRNAAFAATRRICAREGLILDQKHLKVLPRSHRRTVADAIALAQRYI